jgi:hypothetical protein
MSKSGQEEWMKDVRETQQNIVFPGTLRNEASGWRGLITSKRPLTAVQVVGIGLMYLGMGVVFWGLISDKLRRSKGSPFIERLVGGFGDWIVLFVIFAAFFLLLRWRVRRALITDKRRESGRHDLH